MTEPGPERGIVFQQYSLLPWLTVRDNVALAVDAVNPTRPAPERRRMTDELIALVNLTPAAGSGRASCRAACGSGSRSLAGSRCSPSSS